MHAISQWFKQLLLGPKFEADPGDLEAELNSLVEDLHAHQSEDRQRAQGVAQIADRRRGARRVLRERRVNGR